jgi:hypothetical protein
MISADKISDQRNSFNQKKTLILPDDTELPLPNKGFLVEEIL